jgi:hypothetical protein
MEAIHKSIDIDGPVDRVFGYVDDPSKTPEWLPSMMEVHDVSGRGVAIRDLVAQQVLKLCELVASLLADRDLEPVAAGRERRGPGLSLSTMPKMQGKPQVARPARMRFAGACQCAVAISRELQLAKDPDPPTSKVLRG